MTDTDPIRECFDALSSDVLLTPGHTAAVLAVSPKTLEDWRAKGIRPPPWLKLGDPLGKTSPVRYRVGDLREMLRGSSATLSTSAATAARAAVLDGLDEPALRPGRARTSAHRTALGFLSSASSTDAWPFLLAGPDGRPLDAPGTMGTDIDGVVEWLTLDEYATAWSVASTQMREREARERAEADHVVLSAVRGDDEPDRSNQTPRRHGGPGGL